MTGESGMRDRAAQSDWADAPSLVIGYAGTDAGVASLRPALRALAHRPGRTLLLWPAEVAPPEATGFEVLPYRLPPTGDVVERIAAHAPWGAVVLAEPGWTALELAHLCYLAGVERRAGVAAEFGGAVLSDPVPPVPVPAPERHLALLAALGLDRAEAVA